METQNLNMNAFNEKNELNTSNELYYSKSSNENIMNLNMLNTSGINNQGNIGSYNLSGNTSLVDYNESAMYHTNNPNINNKS